MDGMQIFRWGKMCDAQLDATQILASRRALAESGVQNRPTLARVEIPMQYIFGAFLTAKRAGSRPAAGPKF